MPLRGQVASERRARLAQLVAHGGHLCHDAYAKHAEEAPMTVIWFVIWLIANNVGGNEPLLADPVNAWAATLILAVGLDLSRAGGIPRRD
jgi:hypothetical protein